MASKAKAATPSLTEQAAAIIEEDLDGAGYYKDEGSLADFLVGFLGASTTQAARIASAIIQDREAGTGLLDEAGELIRYIDRIMAGPDVAQPGEMVNCSDVQMAAVEAAPSAEDIGA